MNDAPAMLEVTAAVTDVGGESSPNTATTDHFVWLSVDSDDYIDAIHGFLAEHGLAAASAATGGRSRALWDPYDALTPGERRCVRLARPSP